MGPSDFQSTPDGTPHEQVVRPVRTDRRGGGGLTKRRAAGPHWRRTSPGRYVPADTPVTPEQRVVEAAAALPAYGGVTGWSALRWSGGAWFDGLAPDGATPLPVQLACDHRRPVTASA